ncbi:MAG: DUF2141 domain-containing protein [Cyclobacteriaceae bacterium]|nr:DUF2141 domain-containing protein [Cyclobacteriaceae bacterium]
MKALIVLLLCCVLPSCYGQTATGKLVVTMSNVKKAGMVHVGIFKPGKKFPDSQLQVTSQAVSCKETCTIVFDQLPFGEYAIAIFQDENGNGDLDTGMLGIPSEPFAFSNDFKPMFGGPDFTDCSFNFEREGQSVSIRMINSLFGGN